MLDRLLLDLHGAIQVTLLIPVGFRTVTIEYRSAALILSNAAKFIIQISTCLILLITHLYSSTFVVKSVIAEVLITKSRVVHASGRDVVTADVLTCEVRILTVY